MLGFIQWVWDALRLYISVYIVLFGIFWIFIPLLTGTESSRIPTNITFIEFCTKADWRKDGDKIGIWGMLLAPFLYLGGWIPWEAALTIYLSACIYFALKYGERMEWGSWITMLILPPFFSVITIFTSMIDIILSLPSFIITFALLFKSTTPYVVIILLTLVILWLMFANLKFKEM
jgi:hypothetical protein